MTSEDVLARLRLVHEQGPYCKFPGTFKEEEPKLTQEVKAAYYDRMAGLLGDLFSALDFERDEEDMDREACERDGVCRFCGQKKVAKL